MTTQNPIDLARETLKQLTSRKLLPTPENFERVYHEIANVPLERENKLAQQLLRALESQGNHQAAGARTLMMRMRQAVTEAKWEQLPQLVVDYLRQTLHEKELSQSWGELIQDLVRQWDLRLANLPQSHKQIALERVLINFGNQPEELNHKLYNLLQNWSLSPAARPAAQCPEAAPAAEPAASNAASSPAAPPASGMPFSENSWRQWRKTFGFVLKQGIGPQLSTYPDLLDKLDRLLDELDQVSEEEGLSAFVPKIRAFMIKLELHAVQKDRMVTALSNLLGLLLENVAELNRDDNFLVGQIASLQDVLAQQPLSMHQVYHLETSLKEVIRKQGALKSSLDQAASSLRALLDSFLSRLAQMTDSTDDFHNKIGKHSQRLRETQDVAEIGTIINSLMEDTSAMQLNLIHSRDELATAHEQVQVAEKRIKELEGALESASTKVREDQLTGAYNRRGLAEHFEREISRAERTNQPLCLALIDVDNFKQLNDRYGHLAGDDALKYLVDVIRQHSRATDVVARFGGEEFVILLPDTSPDDARHNLQRLQREMTKTFFLANNDRLVITFSAGVAKWHLGERDTDVIERADRAMYQAKLAGKNRVISAENATYLDPDLDV
jgi:diguanylate cyclase